MEFLLFSGGKIRSIFLEPDLFFSLDCCVCCFKFHRAKATDPCEFRGSLRSILYTLADYCRLKIHLRVRATRLKSNRRLQYAQKGPAPTLRQTFLSPRLLCLIQLLTRTEKGINKSWN